MRNKVHVKFGYEKTLVEFQKIVDFVTNLEVLQKDKASTKAVRTKRIETTTVATSEAVTTAVDKTPEMSSGARP